MTLLLTEIHCLDGLSHSCVIFAADRRISRSGKYDGTRKKVFQIPYLHAGVGFFGLAAVSVQPRALSMSDWLSRFIQRNSHLTSLQAFAGALTKSLNADIASQLRQRYISGFHLAGYNSAGLPEFWYVRNVKDDSSTITGVYEEREDFLRRDAISLGYDGYNPHSVQTGVVQRTSRSCSCKPLNLLRILFIGHIGPKNNQNRINRFQRGAECTVQTYRNGDIRAHITAWERIDEGFGALLQERQFKKLRTIHDYEQWVKFKMELISYFYKKYCRESLVARPIDTFSIERRNA